MPETECPLCKRLLRRRIVNPDVPDFCLSCYMERIYPKVEQIMQSIPTGEQIPDVVMVTKRVLAELRK